MAREISFEVSGDKILVDGGVFDWGLDDDAINDANRHADKEEFMRAIHNDIMNHFLNSISEVLGFRPTMRQVNEAIKRGYISNDSCRRERQ
jgi:hypothetical protein